MTEKKKELYELVRLTLTYNPTTGLFTHNISASLPISLRRVVCVNLLKIVMDSVRIMGVIVSFLRIDISFHFSPWGCAGYTPTPHWLPWKSGNTIDNW